MGNVSNLKSVAEPWSYGPNYTLTKTVLHSDKPLAKVAKYTSVIVAVLAIVETIKGLVAIPFKVLGNIFGLYKYPMLKTPRMEKMSDEKSSYNSLKTVLKKAINIADKLFVLGFLSFSGYMLWKI